MKIGDQIMKLIERLERIQTKEIDDWERGFMESLHGQVKKGYSLSQKQLDILSKTENKHSDEAVAKRKDWEEQWNDEKKAISKIMAHYYHAMGEYFFFEADRILHSKGFIPSEKQYNKMCKNDYAQKVIDATFEDPKYQVGSMVSIRSNCGADAYTRRFQLREMKNTPALIVSVGDKPVLSSAKGAKVYKVLPMGRATTFHIEERHLKKFKEPKKRSKKIGSQENVPF